MLVSVFLLVRTRSFVSRAQAVKGTVIEMMYGRISSTSNRGGGYAPVYQFMTSDGQSIVKQDSLASNPPRFQIGQEIDVLYESEKPEKARINKWMNLYFLPTLLWGIGLVFVGVGVVIQLG